MSRREVHFKTSLHLLLSFRRSCFAVRLQKCFVDEDILLNFPSAWRWVKKFKPLEAVQFLIPTISSQFFKQKLSTQAFQFSVCFVSLTKNKSEENGDKDGTSDLHMVTDIWSREDNRLDHMTTARRGGGWEWEREMNRVWQLNILVSDRRPNRDKQQLLLPEVMNYPRIQTLWKHRRHVGRGGRMTGFLNFTGFWGFFFFHHCYG